MNASTDINHFLFSVSKISCNAVMNQNIYYCQMKDILTTSVSNNLDNPQFLLETGLSPFVKEDSYYSLFQ